jgi:diguanylate cyclase (GGDEF)-like protein/PAS domain S-box-containing protein
VKAERDIQNGIRGKQMKEPVQDLRHRAEKIAKKKCTIPLCNCEGLKLEQSQKLLQELQVHQIELTLQNEELRATQAELEESRARYFDLYDLAPVGYLTLNEDGLIIITNLTAANLLGVVRSSLLKTRFTDHILRDDQDLYYHHNKSLFENKTPQSCELRMINNRGQLFWAHLQATVVTDEVGKPTNRIVITDITERKKTEAELRHLSFHDQLTGLFNRHYFEEEMKRLDTPRQLPIGIIMADLNGLKLTNDTYGHDAGDEMLKKAALILKEACREEDIITRWGGDEFVLLLPQTSDEILVDIGKRIKNLCSETVVRDVPVSIALGVAVKSEPAESLIEVLRKAENEMYRQKMIESKSTKNAVLGTLIEALAAKSFETKEHAQKMQDMAFKIGKKSGLPDSELTRLNLLITLHDIGKINISEKLLTKNKPLSDDEWSILKKHPEIGYRLALATEDFAHIAEDILTHHEWWNGKGYPRGLENSEIPLLARIVTIVDAYEIMRNGRPYKPPMTEEEIITELKRCSGTQFDPELVAILLAILADEQ